MVTSEAGLSLIKRSEGLRFHTYDDVAGFPTIGFGHKLRAGESYPSGINLEQANTLLTEDVRIAEQAVERLVRVPLTQGRFDALVDFVYNLGAARLEHSTLLVELNAQHYLAASGELMKWDHAGHVELAALKARRQAEYNLWNGRNQ